VLRMTFKQVVLATDMADRATARAEAAESLCQQQQQQLQLQAQQQQQLTSKESTTKEQLKHLRSDGDARVIAEREESLRSLHAGGSRSVDASALRLFVYAYGGGDVTLVRAAGEDQCGKCSGQSRKKQETERHEGRCIPPPHLSLTPRPPRS
jgi:hypothetical protein